MTIGYGYGDEHINRIIAGACRTNGLHLFAWNAGSRPLDLVKDGPRSRHHTALRGQAVE
jgi:hypothetical protein